ncbi:MAG: hypothetical protein AABW51_01460 [Nanoarchaeota archaeon]
MDETFQRNIVFYEHKKLVVAGTTGSMEKRLSSVSEQLTKECWPVEVADSRLEPGSSLRIFQALFKFNAETKKPEFDITIVQYDPFGESNFPNNSIVGYGLDKPGLVETVEKVAEAIGFVSYPVERSVKKTWSKEFEIEKEGYVYYEKIARALNQPLETAFGLVRYTHFLTAYQSMPEIKAQIQAAERLNIRAR